jgi:RNA polymerase sigma factor (TIGR02999 family)
VRQDPRVTALLHAWRAGDERAYGDAVTALYGELKRRAVNCLRGDRARDAIQATALVSETFIRLAPAGVEWKDRVHFLAVATTTMRRVLVDLARARAASKRGSRPVHVTLPADVPAVGVDAVELLALDEALTRLAVQDERKARVVELRFFGDLTVEETAAVLGVAADTVARDWRMARAWLRRELESAPPAISGSAGAAAPHSAAGRGARGRSRTRRAPSPGST